MQIKGVPIRRLLRGGASQGGHQIWFEVEFEDRRSAAFLLNTDKIGKFITELTAIGTKAAKQRIKGGEHADGMGQVTSDPFHAENIGVGHGPTRQGGVIALRVQTKEKIPVDLAMTPDLARKLIRGIEAHLMEIANPTPPSRKN